MSPSACPGCGGEFDGDPTPMSGRNASTACWLSYGDAAGFELNHRAELARWHQLLVDTYAAQHVAGTGPAIGPAFALLGLCLTLERGWTGDRVRAIHQHLGRRSRDWPRFDRPGGHADSTVASLVARQTPEEWSAALREWAGSVWRHWQPRHTEIRAFVDASLLEFAP